jgi:redox-sensitive bicupin YhaK (pirin superfamily)
MKTVLHTANSRGHASHGWLNSYHSFSFAGYHDADRIHFGALRVLNDDSVAAGMGFGKHPHDNMEIVSIPLSGDLHHKDSTGRDKIIRQGDVQIMSAGSGIAHSETNANKDREVKFLQVWVFPKEKNIEPRYDQKSFNLDQQKDEIVTVAAPNNDNAVWINQDAWFSMAKLSAGKDTTYQVNREGNGVYVFVIDGNVTINGQELQSRDGLGIWETDSLQIKAGSEAQLLLIDVPMSIPEV